MIFDKLLWLIKRHPFLYRTRFRLLSKNVSEKDLQECSYNESNPKHEIPLFFNEVNKIIFSDNYPQTDIEKVKRICVWLAENVKGGPGLSEPSELALKSMLAGRGGVCSDIAQVFNNFCVINDLKVREWGTTRIPFSKDFGGHSFNEVYCKEFNKWIFIDVYYTAFFYNKNNLSKPLSVLETFKSIRNNENVICKTITDLRELGEAGLKRNYLHLDTAPFLICNYHNKTYDNLLKYTRPAIPVFISHFSLFIANRSYDYNFPIDDYKKLFSKV